MKLCTRQPGARAHCSCCEHGFKDGIGNCEADVIDVMRNVRVLTGTGMLGNSAGLVRQTRRIR